MGEVVNLRQVKKRRLRAQAADAAKESRIRHGRTKAEKANDQRAAERAEARLDGLRRGEPRE
jgi:hypothetical protein